MPVDRLKLFSMPILEFNYDDVRMRHQYEVEIIVSGTSRRARQLSDTADDMGEKLREKSVTMAINEVAMGDHHVDRTDLYEALNSAEKKAK